MVWCGVVIVEVLLSMDQGMLGLSATGTGTSNNELLSAEVF